MTAVQAEATVLEGNGSAGGALSFLISLDKDVVSRVELRVSTLSAVKTGFASNPGAARGGTACTEGVDFISLQDQPVVLAAGAKSGAITVQVCPDADFEPNEVLYLSWKPVGGAATTVKGVIINDDAGGLNGTGATALLGGLPAFGRDVIDKTRSNADGALGFSLETQSGDVCILDKVTGLLWQRDWSASLTYGFTEVASLVNSVNQAALCGKTDWRLPATNELLSLLDFSATSLQAMNADAVFPSYKAMSGSFWTRQEVAGAADNAWVVSPGAGGGAVTYQSKTGKALVRLVSGSARADTCQDAAERFVVWVDASTPAVPDGTVYDKRSGLMWRQCTEGFAGAQCNQAATPPFNTATATETDLANWVRNVNANPSTLGAGYSDWRIPTVKELASLVDRCTPSAPAINPTFFPGSYANSYITSTVNSNDSSKFWYVDFAGGSVGVGSTANKYLRLVRAGQ